MASAKQVNEAFLTTCTKNDREIEKAVYRNINRFRDKDIKEVHDNLLKVFNIKSIEDSKYRNTEEFKQLVENSRAKKKEAEKKAKGKEKKELFTV